MNAVHLPASKKQVSSLVPALPQAPATPEGELVDITGDEAVLDVKFCESSLGLQVIGILGRTEGAGVQALAAAAGGDMIRGLRQRLAPGVAAQRRKALRKTLLQADLHRVITG